MLYACDARWWREYRPDFAGERWTVDRELIGAPGMHWVDAVDEPGISENQRRIHLGGNGGYQAIALAVLWGARRIVLLGYDMQRTGGRLHWHADHGAHLDNPGEFETWRRRLDVAAADLRRLDVEVLNASRQSALTCFERVPLELALKER